jgi:two-component system chemotaxis response regulator CheY
MSNKPFRILVIDDSAPFRRQVAGALESSGLAVFEADEGVEALWRVRAEGVFDLVIVDIHMPKLDGMSFIREVRKLSGYAEIPIIVITSDGSRERRQEGRRAGATAWLLKPCDLPGLVNAVHAALMRIIKMDPVSTTKPGSQAPNSYSFSPKAGPSTPRSRGPGPRFEDAPRSRTMNPRTDEPPRSPRNAPRPDEPARSQRAVLQPAPSVLGAQREAGSKPPGSSST